MTLASLRLRHLCFTGPEKPKANVEFNAGLNVIYGASDTGKSFVVEAIDFMLGAKGPLSDIPERVGYDRIFLGVEASENTLFTLTRATTGGQFQMYEGLHDSVPAGVTAVVLGAIHSPKKATNVSRFLLGKVGLDGKKVRTDADNETRAVSFRDLCHERRVAVARGQARSPRRADRELPAEDRRDGRRAARTRGAARAARREHHPGPGGSPGLRGAVSGPPQSSERASAEGRERHRPSNVRAHRGDG